VNPPRHPLGPDFDRAADAWTAWRKQQEAALTAAQKLEFQKFRFEQNRKIREHNDKFYESEPARIRAAKQKIMLEKPDLALRMLPLQKMKEARAYHLAQEVVHRQHDMELQTMENDHQQERDRFLYDAETARQTEAVDDKQHENDDRQRLADAFRQRAAQRDFGRGDPERER
jgi:hypothetical protein